MRRAKKVLAMFLSILTLVTQMLPIGAYAAPIVKVKNVVSETAPVDAAADACGDNLTWAFDAATGTLTISGTGAMWDYEPQASRPYPTSPWYNGTVIYEPTTVIIEEGVTSIGSYAFWIMTSIENVSLPETLKSIGEQAFYSCTHIESLTLPVSLTNIGDWAFGECTALTTVNYGGTEADRANMTIGAVNDPLLNAAWTYAEEVTIGGECGDNLTWTFDAATGTLTISGEGEMGDMYENGEYIMPWEDYKENIRVVVVEEGVTVIENHAFSDCINLNKVELPTSLVVLGNFSFENCSSLTSVSLPVGLTATYECVFAHCTALTEVILPEGLESISNGAFMYCSNLASLKIPDSVWDIGISAFEGCDKLTNISIPEKVTSISYYLFRNCTALESIYIPENITDINDGAFNGCTALATVNYGGTEADRANITIGTNNELLTNAAWTYYTYPTEGEFGENLTWIFDRMTGTLTISGTGAMPDYSDDWRDVPWLNDTDNRYRIKKVIIGEGVTTIGASAFYECDQITEISIPSTLLSIGEGAFNCSVKLEAIDLPEGLITIADYAFIDCWALRDVVIPSTVETIGRSAFAYCKNITKITVPEKVTEIGKYTFTDCTSLTSISLPKGLTSIGQYAFNGCTALTTVSYDGTETDRANITIGEYNDPLLNAEWIGYAAQIGNTKYTTFEEAFETAESGDTIVLLRYASFDEDVTIDENMEITLDLNGFDFDAYIQIDVYGHLTIKGKGNFFGSGNGFMHVHSGGFATLQDAAFYQEGDGSNIFITVDGSLEINSGTFYPWQCAADASNGTLIITGGSFYMSDSNEEGNSTNAEIVSGNVLISGGTFDRPVPEKYCVEGYEPYDNGDGTYTVVQGLTEAISGECGDHLTWILSTDGILTISGTGAMSDYEYVAESETIDSPWYAYRRSIKKVVIEDGVTSIGNSAFEGCKAMTEIVLPDGLTSIGESAFYECSGLAGIDLPDTIETIGERTFTLCDSLSSVALPANLKEIPNYLFIGCAGLTEVIIPEGVVSIGNSAFQECPMLTTVVLPETLTSLGEFVFRYSGLTTIVLPESMTSIADYAFCDCEKLESITVPKTINSIGMSAFFNCYVLTDVYYSGSVIDRKNITIAEDNEPLLNANWHYAEAVVTNLRLAENATQPGKKTVGKGCYLELSWWAENDNPAAFPIEYTVYYKDKEASEYSERPDAEGAVGWIKDPNSLSGFGTSMPEEHSDTYVIITDGVEELRLLYEIEVLDEEGLYFSDGSGKSKVESFLVYTGEELYLETRASSSRVDADVWYTWYRDGESIEDGTQQIWIYTDDLGVGSYTYTCNITDGTETITYQAEVVVQNPTGLRFGYSPYYERKNDYWQTEGDYISLGVYDVTNDDGSEIFYQWYKNGEIIEGATDNWYEVGEIQLSDEGDVYLCRISDANDEITYEVTLYKVNPQTNLRFEKGILDEDNAMHVYLQPGDFGNLAIHIPALSDREEEYPISYQWYAGSPEGSWYMIDGAESSVWTVTRDWYYRDYYGMDDMSKAEYFVLRASDESGSIDAYVYVEDLWFSDASETEIEVLYGNEYIIRAEAVSAIGDVTYQWYKDGELIEGEASSEITVNVMSEEDLSTYTCRVSHSFEYETELGTNTYRNSVSRDFKLYINEDTQLNIDTFEIIDGEKLHIKGTASANANSGKIFLDWEWQDEWGNYYENDYGFFDDEIQDKYFDEETGRYICEFDLTKKYIQSYNEFSFTLKAQGTHELEELAFTYLYGNCHYENGDEWIYAANVESVETNLRFENGRTNIWEEIDLKAEDIGTIVLDATAVNDDPETYPITYRWSNSNEDFDDHTDPTMTVEIVGRDDISDYYRRNYIEYRAKVTDTQREINATWYLNTFYFLNDDGYEYHNVDLGEVVLLEAEVYSARGNEVSYQWYKDDVAIEGATSRAYAVVVDDTADYGTYRCYASENIGEGRIYMNYYVYPKTTSYEITDLYLVGNEKLIVKGNAMSVPNEMWDYTALDLMLWNREGYGDDDEMVEIYYLNTDGYDESAQGLFSTGIVYNASTGYIKDETCYVGIDFEIIRLDRFAENEFWLDISGNYQESRLKFNVTEENGEYSAQLILDDGTVLEAVKLENDFETDLAFTENANNGEDLLIPRGESYTFNAEAVNNDAENHPISYQWYDSYPSAGVSPLEGETNPTYMVTIENDKGVYYCLVTDGVEKMLYKTTYMAADGLVFAGDSFNRMSGKGKKFYARDIGYTVGENLAADAAATNGAGEISYQWYFVDSGEDVGVALEGETSPIFRTNDVLSYSKYTGYNGNLGFYCIASDGVEEIRFDMEICEIMYDLGLEITSHNGAENIEIPLSANDMNREMTLSVEAKHNGAADNIMSYQWYLNNEAIAGATEASYTFKMTDWLAAERGPVLHYHCEVTCTNHAAQEIYSEAYERKTQSFTVLSLYDKDENNIIYAESGKAVTLKVDPVSSVEGDIEYQWMKDYTPIKGATEQTLVVTPYHRYDLGDYECLVTVHIGGEQYYTISRYFTKRLAYDSGTELSIDTFELKDGKLMIGGSASSNKIKEDDYLEVVIRDGKTNPEIGDASLGIFTRESLRSWEKTGSFNKEFVISVGELALDDLGIYEIYASSYTAESKPVVLSFELKESGVVLAKLTDEKGNTKSLEIAGPETTQLRFKADAESFIQLKAEDIGSLVLSGEAVNNDSEKAITYTWKVGGKVVGNEAVYTLESIDLADISYNYSARLTISVTASDGMESISRDFYLETLYFTEDFDAHGSADMYPYADDKITLTAEAYSALSETLSYQWYKDGTAIEGANEASFTIEKMRDADYGEYSCEVSDGVHENTIRRSFRLMEKDYAMRISEFKLVDNASLILRGNAYKNKTEEWSYCDVYFINLGERIPEYKTDGEEMTELSERGMHLAGLVRNNSYKYETEESFNCDIDIELLDLPRLMLGDYTINMNCSEYDVNAYLVVTEENGEYTAKLVFDDGTVLVAEKASSEEVVTDLKLTANANMVSENSAGYAMTVYAKAGERYVFCAEATNNDPENYPITYSWYDADPRAYGSTKKIDDGANCGIEITESGTIWCVITDGVETITLAQTYEVAEGAVFASHDQYGGNGVPAGQKYFFGERNMMPESIVTLDATAINGAAAFSYAWTLNGNEAGNESKLTVYGYQLENDHVNTAVCTVTDGVETLTMEIDLIPMEWLNSWNVKTNLRVTVPEDLNYETSSEPTYRVGLTNSDIGGLTLAVAAENDDPEIYPISYQWYLDEEELAGETNASLEIPLTLQDVIDGNFGRYKVVISDGIEEKIVWFELISFYFTEEDPQYAVPAKPNEKVTFDAAAVSVLDSSLGYQWFRNGEAITGATEATYTITASIADFSSAYLCDVPRYTCTVTDNVMGKQLTSNEYYLVYDVEPQLKIDNFAFLGDKLVFGGEASAEKYYANGSFDFRIESEDENGALIIPVGNDVLGGYKREYETKTHDCLEFEYYIKNVTELSVGKYELSMMYDAKGYFEGEDWYYNGEVWYLEIEKSWDSRYTATLTSPDGTVKTVTSEALGGTGLEIVGKPEEFFYIPTEGSSEQIALSAEATNMNETILPISYQWYFTPYGSNTMEQIEGANDPIYVVDPSDEANFGTYHCDVSDGVESRSYSGHILYGTTLDWVSTPNVFANIGETATITVEASSDAGEVSYTWYKEEISEGCMIGTGPTLTIESVAERDYDSSFICVATDGYRTIEKWLHIRPQTNLTLTLEQDNILVKKGEKVEIRGFATMDKESGKELGIMMAILEPWQDVDGFWHDGGVNEWLIVSEENDIWGGTDWTGVLDGTATTNVVFTENDGMLMAEFVITIPAMNENWQGDFAIAAEDANGGAIKKDIHIEMTDELYMEGVPSEVPEIGEIVVVTTEADPEIEAALKEEIGENTDILWAQDIKLVEQNSGKEYKHNGKIKLNIPVGKEYNGRMAKVYHYFDDGSYEVLEGVIKNGKVTIEVESLSPFFVVLSDEEVAMIGETIYSSLAEAITAANDGDVITLISDVKLSEKLSISKNVTIDLNGHAITADFVDSYGTIYVGMKGDLTLKDSAGTGSISNKNAVVIGVYGKLTVEGGTYTSGEEYAALYNFYYNGETYGTTEVKGGTFTSSVWNCGKLDISGGIFADIDNSGQLVITDAVVNGEIIAKDGSDAPALEGKGTIAISGGKYANAVEKAWCAEGYVPSNEVVDGYYGVETDPAVYSEAVIGETYYATIDEAIGAAKSGDTVVLLKDVASANGLIAVYSGVTLDLDGNDLEADYVVAFNGGQIIDSAVTRIGRGTGETGVLYVKEGNLILNANNPMMPVYNGSDGYLFATYLNRLIKETGETEGSIKLVINAAPTMNVLEYMKDGVSDNDIKVVLRLSWQTENGIESKDVVFSDENLIVVYESNKGTQGSYGKNLGVKITGYEGLEGLDATLMVISGTHTELVLNKVDIT